MTLAMLPTMAWFKKGFVCGFDHIDDLLVLFEEIFTQGFFRLELMVDSEHIRQPFLTHILWRELRVQLVRLGAAQV